MFYITIVDIHGAAALIYHQNGHQNTVDKAHGPSREGNVHFKYIKGSSYDSDASTHFSTQFSNTLKML